MTNATFLNGLFLLACATTLASAAYVMLAIWRVIRFRPARSAVRVVARPVTVLKPVCGLDANLDDNLRSFCRQDYPAYQVVFGVRDADDPAIPLIERLIADFPDRDLALVVDPRVIGPNLKVSNLANMMAAAKHDLLVMADSDMRVTPGYLSNVAAPFADDKVGVVTCLYSATPAGGLPSLLGSMFINEGFLPSVLVSAGFADITYGLGASIALRRDLLERIGGFDALAHHLADDHMVGKFICAQGYRVVLSDYVVENIVHEKSLRALFRHELRWSQTVRACEPLGHAFSFLMYGVPLAFFAALMVDVTYDWDWFEAILIGAAVALRLWMHFAVRRRLGLAVDKGAFWLVPLRDVLSFLVWSASFFGRKIDWKDATFTVSPDGLMASVERQET